MVNLLFHRCSGQNDAHKSRRSYERRRAKGKGATASSALLPRAKGAHGMPSPEDDGGPEAA
jgi:hypothetical protein